MSLRLLDLFSGYGGFSLGLKLAGIPIRTVLYCEIETYCQEIIRARIRDGFLDDAPIWPDVRTLDGRLFTGKVGIITAGFPCQPHSIAGKRRGSSDKRNLWPDTLRLIREVEPQWVLLENVPGILANGYAGTVVGQLSEAGYDCLWNTISAAEVGASHRRNRWWCLAYARCAKRGKNIEPSKLESGSIGLQREGSEATGRFGNCCEALGDSQSQPSDNSNRSSGPEEIAETPSRRFHRCPFPPPPDGGEAWRETLEYESELEPAIRGMAHGPPHRVDRLKALGNGIVPAVVRHFLLGEEA